MKHPFLSFALTLFFFALPGPGMLILTAESAAKTGAGNSVATSRSIDSGEKGHVFVYRYHEEPGDGSLLVSFEPESVHRLERTLQLRLYSESWFDPEERIYRLRPVALLTGSGLNPGGLRFDPRLPQEDRPFLGKLALFHEQASALEKQASEMRQLERPWMEGGTRALGDAVPYGEILLDFRRRPSTVTVSWDLEIDRYAMHIDHLYIIDHRMVPGVEVLLRNLPFFMEKKDSLRHELAQKRGKAAEFFEAVE